MYMQFGHGVNSTMSFSNQVQAKCIISAQFHMWDVRRINSLLPHSVVGQIYWFPADLSTVIHSSLEIIIQELLQYHKIMLSALVNSH